MKNFKIKEKKPTLFLEKQGLDTHLAGEIKSFFLNKLKLESFNSYGKLTKNKSLQDRLSFNFLDQKSDDYKNKLNHSQKKEIKRYQNKINKIIIDISGLFFPFIKKRLLGKMYKNSIEIIGYITCTKHKSYLLKAHTDHPAILLTILLPLQDLDKSSVEFLKQKTKENIFNKKFQNLKKFKTIYKTKIKSGHLVAWVPNSESWHCVRRSKAEQRFTFNIHLRIKKDFLKNYYGKKYINGIDYPINFSKKLKQSFFFKHNKCEGNLTKTRFIKELKFTLKSMGYDY